MRKCLMTVVLCLVAAVSVLADVKMPSLFADHMVIQRDTKAPVWGWADAEIISKDSIAVSHLEISEPTVVRYAWSINQPGGGQPLQQGRAARIDVYNGIGK